MLEGSGGIYGTRKNAIQSMLDYVESEGQCMARIRTRVAETNVKIQKGQKELEQISKLGLGKVEIHMRTSLEEDNSNMNEDMNLLKHLEGQALAMLESVTTIVANVVAEPGTIVENDLAVVIGQIKNGFMDLNCCGTLASEWSIPQIQPARKSSTSSGGFDTDKAASLGLSALIPKNYNDSNTSDTKVATAAAPAAAAAGKSPRQAKTKAASKSAAAPVFKGWGAPKSNGSGQKSLATIQQEEMLAKSN